MSLRAKLSLVALVEVIAMVTLVAFLALRHSRTETEKLARDLLRARTESAFSLCEANHALNGQPDEALRTRISAVRLFDEGYIFVMSNALDIRGKLLIHPTREGDVLLDKERFPHIRSILDDIAATGNQHGADKFITYTQGSDARGRQGERKIAFYKYFKPWDWVLITSSYEKDVYSSANLVRTRVVEAILIVGFLSIIVVNVTVARMLRPLNKLIETTKEVAAGNLDAQIDVNAGGEIGRLSSHFNDMLVNLKQNTRVWQELSIARQLQREMLPAGRPQIPGVDIEARTLPATEVGGDFYDFMVLDENRFAVLIGDVSGKGIFGAMGMSSALSALRFATEERQNTHEILELANRRLIRDIQRHMFVAVFLGIFDRRERCMYYTNAGQTMPILSRNGEADFLTQSDADRFPLGIRPEVTFAQQSIKLSTDDKLIFYTDGIIEVFNGNREHYGFDRFRESIVRHNASRLPEMAENLLSDAEAYIGDNDFDDDVTIVILKLQ